MKVVKFGGSSVASATQIEKVGDIIKSDQERKLVVVSAPCKRDSNDFKITDMLIQMGEAYLGNQSYKDYLATIMERFKQIVHELNIPSAVLEDIELSINNVLVSTDSDDMKLDAIKALGADSCAKIISEYLNYLGLEASYINENKA